MTAPHPDRLLKKSVEISARISRIMRRTHRKVAAAESLTSGSISCHLGAAESSSEWFLGSVIAYDSEVKFSVLGVERGSVITADCARQMADGTAKMMHADFAVAVTGAGGPQPEEDQPAGTVFIAVHTPTGTSVAKHRFLGNPSEVVQETTLRALQMLEEATIKLARVPDAESDTNAVSTTRLGNDPHSGEPQ